MLDQRGREAGDNLRQHAEERAAQADFGEVQRVARRQRTLSTGAVMVLAVLMIVSTAWLGGVGDSRSVADVESVSTVPVPTAEAQPYPYRVDDALWRAEGNGDGFVECEPCRRTGQIEFVMATHEGSGRFHVIAYGDDGPQPQEMLEATPVSISADGDGIPTRRFVGYRRIDADLPEAAIAGADSVVVDTTGDYSGRIFLRPYGEWLEDSPSIVPAMVTGFSVSAGGDWTLAAYPPGYRPDYHGDTISGVGDDLVAWDSGKCGEGDRLQATHSGPGRFLVLLNDPWIRYPIVVFDETGPGVIAVDGFCGGFYGWEIHADGPWTLGEVPANSEES